MEADAVIIDRRDNAQIRNFAIDFITLAAGRAMAARESAAIAAQH
jgi:hypothetical protein